MNITQFASLTHRVTLGIPDSWIEYTQHMGTRDILFRIGVTARDNHNPAARPRAWYGRWWVVTPDMNEQQVKNTLLAAVLAYVEHEARERFKIDGKAPYENSH